jgi:hypothetical protein
MAMDTQVTLVLQSASLYEALLRHLGDWRLQDHEFDSEADEVRVSYDVGGSGRIALTLGFELTEAQMAEILRNAVPASG